MLNTIKNHKNRVAIIACVVVALASFTYYLSLPKVSDIEKYEREGDVASIVKVYNKAQEEKYQDVRAAAISAALRMTKNNNDIYNFIGPIISGRFDAKPEAVAAFVKEISVDGWQKVALESLKDNTGKEAFTVFDKIDDTSVNGAIQAVVKEIVNDSNAGPMAVRLIEEKIEADTISAEKSKCILTLLKAADPGYLYKKMNDFKTKDNPLALKKYITDDRENLAVDSAIGIFQFIKKGCDEKGVFDKAVYKIDYAFAPEFTKKFDKLITINTIYASKVMLNEREANLIENFQLKKLREELYSYDVDNIEEEINELQLKNWEIASVLLTAAGYNIHNINIADMDYALGRAVMTLPGGRDLFRDMRKNDSKIQGLKRKKVIAARETARLEPQVNSFSKIMKELRDKAKEYKVFKEQQTAVLMKEALDIAKNLDFTKCRDFENVLESRKKIRQGALSTDISIGSDRYDVLRILGEPEVNGSGLLNPAHAGCTYKNILGQDIIYEFDWSDNDNSYRLTNIRKWKSE